MPDEYDGLDEHEQNVYGDDAREKLLSDDAIDPEEEAFMKGYEEADEFDDEDDDEEPDDDED